MIKSSGQFENLLFIGKVKKASGSFKNPIKNFEQIMFSQNQNVLKNISNHDWLYKNLISRRNAKKYLKKTIVALNTKRPLTTELLAKQSKINIKKNLKRTSINSRLPSFDSFKSDNSIIFANEEETSQYISVEKLSIVFLESWGSIDEFAFNSLILLNNIRKKISLNDYQIKHNLK